MSSTNRSNPPSKIAFCSLICHLMLRMAFDKCPRARLLRQGRASIRGESSSQQHSYSPAHTLPRNVILGIASLPVQIFSSLKAHDESWQLGDCFILGFSSFLSLPFPPPQPTSNTQGMGACFGEEWRRVKCSFQMLHGLSYESLNVLSGSVF